MNWYKKSSFNGDLLDALVDQLGPDIGGPLTRDIANEISKMGIEYRFEYIAALGMAKNDVCIINKSVLGFPIPNLLFTLFHELGHYYQYKKYGEDFAISVYTNPISDLEKDIHFLSSIESTADKFSRLKTTYYLNKYGIKNPITMSGYKGMPLGQLRNHLANIKKEIKEKNLSSISEINEYIYNMIKA